MTRCSLRWFVNDDAVNTHYRYCAMTHATGTTWRRYMHSLHDEATELHHRMTLQDSLYNDRSGAHYTMMLQDSLQKWPYRDSLHDDAAGSNKVTLLGLTTRWCYRTHYKMTLQVFTTQWCYRTHYKMTLRGLTTWWCCRTHYKMTLQVFTT